MYSDDFIERLRKIDHGFCENCGSPKGHFDQEDDYFCYACNGYEILPSYEAKMKIERRKRRLRELFRNLSLKADISYCLKLFLSLGETYMIDEERRLPNDLQAKYSKRLLIIDPRRIAIANIGVRWLLEDSKGNLGNPIPYNKTFIPKMNNLIRLWFDWTRKERLSDPRYNLGFFIKKKNKVNFYYTQQFDFYLESLNKFFIIDPTQEISDKDRKEVLNSHEKLFRNPQNLKFYIEQEYPTLISTLLNSFYPDEVIRPFSFDNILAVNESKLKEILQLDLNSYRTLIDSIPNKNHIFAQFIVHALDDVVTYYLDKTPLKLTTDGYIKVRSSKEIFRDIVKKRIWIPPLQNYVVASPQNNQIFPFIIELKGKYYISPRRIKIGNMLLNYAINKDMVNNSLSLKNEHKSMRELKYKLKSHGVKIIGREVKSHKQGPFEIDYVGHDEINIYAIECKGFHPSPFFMMRKNRRYNNQFEDKLKKVKKIKHWLLNSLNKARPKKGVLVIPVYDTRHKRPSKIVFPEKFHDIEKEHVFYLYFTQIKEYFEVDNEEIIQTCIDDL